MTSGEKTAYLVFSGLVLGVQLLCTVNDVNVWPFCSYNMFNRTVGDTQWVLRATLSDDDGEELTTDAGALLPVEFFKARAMVYDVLSKQPDACTKAMFAERVLARLSSAPWSQFDETFAPARPRAGHRWVSMRLDAWKLDFREMTDGDPAIADRISVYTYERDACLD